MDIFCFSNINLGTSKTSIKNINNIGNMNINQVGVSMTNYNSDKHCNRNNDVSFNYISSVTLKTNKHTNTDGAASLSNSMIEKIELKIRMMVEIASTMGIQTRVIKNGLICGQVV